MAWSDAAREASIAARKATSVAMAASKGRRPKGIDPRSASRSTLESESSSKAAAYYHGLASQRHDRIAQAMGNAKGAEEHRTAALAHRTAAERHHYAEFDQGIGNAAVQRVTVNVGRAREVVENGVRYLVAPITLIVPGTLPGSQGALYYPAQECAKSVPTWNGIPIVVYHPQVNGQWVSASHPDIVPVGELRNAEFRRKLKAEGWYDAEKTRVADIRVYNALVEGRPMEVSTGLFTENFVEGTRIVARNYRPDHLATLPDQIGACSVRDGCGLNVNKETTVAKRCTDCGNKPCDCVTANAARCPECGSELIDGECEECGYEEDNEKAGVWNRIFAWLTGNAQQRSKHTGQFQPHGAGDGKGPVHEGAKTGFDGPKPVDPTEPVDPVTGDPMKNNAWSDAAREASALARKLTAKATDASAKVVSRSHPTHYAAQYAQQNADVLGMLHHVRSDEARSVVAAHTHEEAANSHGRVASLHRKDGQEEAAKAHDAAAEMHRMAAGEHRQDFTSAGGAAAMTKEATGGMNGGLGGKKAGALREKVKEAAAAEDHGKAAELHEKLAKEHTKKAGQERIPINAENERTAAEHNWIAAKEHRAAMTKNSTGDPMAFNRTAALAVLNKLTDVQLQKITANDGGPAAADATGPKGAVDSGGHKTDDDNNEPPAPKKGLTDNEWLDRAPLGIRDDVLFARNAKEAERTRLIATLNAAGDPALTAYLGGKPLPELQLLAQNFGHKDRGPTPVYIGGAPVDNSNQAVDQDILPLPVMNWSNTDAG